MINFRLLNRNSTTVENETNRQLLLKLKKNEHGELITSAIPVETISTNIIHNNTNEYTNGHPSIIQPHITNMLSNLNDDKQWNSNQVITATPTR